MHVSVRDQQPGSHLFPGLSYSHEKDWKEPFFFIQMTDCQLGFMEENKSWNQEIELLEKAVSHINRLQPRFVIVSGDITHALPHESIREDQVRDYKRIVAQIDSKIPLMSLCGNHDVGNSPDSQAIRTYEVDFGSHYFSFWVGGMQGIVINSPPIWDPSNAKAIYEEQLHWFRDQLQCLVGKKAPTHRIVFSHHPWFLNTFDEEDEYFVIPKVRRLNFLDLMKRADVRACFCGHYHRNNIAQYGKMPIITTSAVGKQLGEDLSGFRIVKVFADKIDHEYVDLDNVPDRILLD